MKPCRPGRDRSSRTAALAAQLEGDVLDLAAVVGVAVAGAAGALARYGVGRALRAVSTEFPWGTFAINVAGCWAIGLAGAVAAHAGMLAPFVRRDVMTGFIGAFTTFSTFTLESVMLAESAPVAAGLYLLGSTAAGLAAAWIGGAL